MAERSNAIGEITRFWLQVRHSCLIYESLPVPVRYGQSDIDLLAITGNMRPIPLPDGTQIGPRLIVETKDEHDWEPKGREFGLLLGRDIGAMGAGHCAPAGSKCKFSMLRQEHFDRATGFFASDDFDRLFVVHAVDPDVTSTYRDLLVDRRIYFISIREVVGDLLAWYSQHGRPSGLRNSLIGDFWHLLVGFCGCKPELSG